MGSSGTPNYSNFFRQIFASLAASKDSDNSNLNHGFLQNSNVNGNHNQNQGLSPMIPLQAPKEIPGGSNVFNRFHLEQQSLLQNSAQLQTPAEILGNLKTLNSFAPQNPHEIPVGSKVLNRSPPEYHLLQNSDRLQIQAENVRGSQSFNIFASKNLCTASNSANHFSSPSQLLPKNLTENVPKVPEKLPSEQLLERPIEIPEEDEPSNETTSESNYEIFSEKDDYSLSFAFQEGLKYCAMVNKNKASNNSITIEEKSRNDPLTAKSSSKATTPTGKGSLKIIDLLAQNLPKSQSRKRKESGEIISQPKGKLQVGSSSSQEFKVENPTYNKATPSLLAAALINRGDQNPPESLNNNTPIPSSISPPNVTMGDGGPLRSRVQTFPRMLYGEQTTPGSTSYKGFNEDMKYRNLLSGNTLYHGTSRLSRSATSAVDSNGKWPSRSNPGIETQKWQSNLVGISNWKGVGEQQVISSFSGEKNKIFQTSPSGNLETFDAHQKMATMLNSTSRTKIDGIGRNQQLEQLQQVLRVPNSHTTSSSFSRESKINIPMSFATNYPSFFHHGNKSVYGISGSSPEWNMLNSIKPTDLAPAVNFDIKMDIEARNLPKSLKLEEEDFESMVNWPEHHLMGTDRFGFDV